MSAQDQLDYLLSRQRLQGELKERATMTETIAFHDNLANHYQRLADEIRVMMRPPRAR